MSKDWVGNSVSVFKGIGASNHADGERASKDFYATSPDAIDALFKKITPPTHNILEPACGDGSLSKRMQEFGYNVISYDIVDRGYGEIQNFFELIAPPFEGDYAIITNPPYSIALEFLLHALELVPVGSMVCMFVKTTFLEGKRRYRDLFSQQPPFLVLQFVERILCAKNGDFEEAKKIGSAVSYCWMVWKKGFKGKPTIDWI